MNFPTNLINPDYKHRQILHLPYVSPKHLHHHHHHHQPYPNLYPPQLSAHQKF